MTIGQRDAHLRRIAMAKGKITIEMEGSGPQTLEFDELHLDMSQTIYRFYDRGELSPSAMAPDGTIRINIVGVNEAVREEFNRLCSMCYQIERAE